MSTYTRLGGRGFGAEATTALLRSIWIDQKNMADEGPELEKQAGTGTGVAAGGGEGEGHEMVRLTRSH